LCYCFPKFSRIASCYRYYVCFKAGWRSLLVASRVASHNTALLAIILAPLMNLIELPKPCSIDGETRVSQADCRQFWCPTGEQSPPGHFD
jgi:hypothetical protein